MHEHGSVLIYHDGSNNEQSVPTCMNKTVNNHVQAGQFNHVQAGQLNHVQACQQAKTSCACLHVYLTTTSASPGIPPETQPTQSVPSHLSMARH